VSCALECLPTYDEALGRLLAAAPDLGCEPVALEEADGRVLAHCVLAPRSRPVAALSAMDGYAIRSADLPAMAQGLTLAGASYAGGAARALAPGQTVRVTTGGAMPAGADRVIVDEVVEVADGAVRLMAAPGARRHVRPIGSDFQAGELLAAAGTRLTAPALMAVAAGEAAVIQVVRRPRVGLVLTGDEIVAPAACAGAPDRVPDTVSFGVAALVRAWGGVVVGLRRCHDRLEDLSGELAALEGRTDLVVVIGGASKSERDHGRSAAAAAASGAAFLFAGVAMKPGKPVWAARTGGRLLVGLPGNPTAALVTARLLLAPLVAQMSGRSASEALRWTPVAVEGPPAAADRDLFLTARGAALGLQPLGRQEASGQRDLALVTALVRRRPGVADAAEALAF
jgi:molybdopterin molybdotransferase